MANKEFLDKEGLTYYHNQIKGQLKDEVIISSEQPEDMDWKIWIDTNGVHTIDSEVVNTLDGDEEDKAPSVKAVKEVIKDSGWIKATLNSGFTHNALASSGDLMYRKIGKIVYIKGSVKGFTDTGQVCTKLPEGYRPGTRIDLYVGTGSTYFAKGFISGSGDVSVSYDNRGTYSADNWYAFCGSFIAS